MFHAFKQEYKHLNEEKRQIYTVQIFKTPSYLFNTLKTGLRGVTIIARLAQSVEYETLKLNLRVVGSSPTLGVFFLPFQMIFVISLS